MLHAKPGEHFEMPIIHLHGNVYRNFSIGIAQHAPQSFIEIELLRRQIEARALRLPRIGFFIHARGSSHRCHKSVLRNNGRSILALAAGFAATCAQTIRVYEGRSRGSKLLTLLQHGRIAFLPVFFGSPKRVQAASIAAASTHTRGKPTLIQTTIGACSSEKLTRRVPCKIPFSLRTSRQGWRISRTESRNVTSDWCSRNSHEHHR